MEKDVGLVGQEINQRDGRRGIYVGPARASEFPMGVTHLGTHVCLPRNPTLCVVGCSADVERRKS